MKIVSHQAKRDTTFKERRLDFVDAGKVFAGRVLTLRDDRLDAAWRRAAHRFHEALS